MNLLIISPGKKPIPAVRGGAVETLIQILIDENEKDKKYNIVLVSSYDSMAKKMSSNYINTKFVYVKTDDVIYKISRAIRYIINRIPKVYIGNAYIKRVKKIIEKKLYLDKYDYVIIENQPEYALTLRKKFNNLILHLHNDCLNISIDMCDKILNCYLKVFALSGFVKDKVLQIDINYKNAYTLYNGVDILKFNKKSLIDLRSQLGISKDDFIYLYAGRIVREKGVLELVSAFNIFKKNHGNVKLLIVGGIPSTNVFTKKFISKFKEKIDDEDIIYVGNVDYDRIPSFYEIANVGVVPTICEEGFGLVVIENFAAGNPVIISDSGGMPELIDDTCGLIAKRNDSFVNNLIDCMEKIYVDFKEYDSHKIKNHANKFTSELYCKKFNELINK